MTWSDCSSEEETQNTEYLRKNDRRRLRELSQWLSALSSWPDDSQGSLEWIYHSDINGLEWTPGKACYAFLFPGRGVSTHHLTIRNYLLFLNVCIRVWYARNMQSWLTYMRVSVYRRKTHDTYRDVESVRPCVSRFPSPCAYSNPLSSPSVTGIEINKQASGAISRSVNIYLTVSRLELPASGVVGRHLRLNLRSWLHRRFLF